MLIFGKITLLLVWQAHFIQEGSQSVNLTLVTSYRQMAQAPTKQIKWHFIRTPMTFILVFMKESIVAMTEHGRLCSISFPIQGTMVTYITEMVPFHIFTRWPIPQHHVTSEHHGLARASTQTISPALTTVPAENSWNSWVASMSKYKSWLTYIGKPNLLQNKLLPSTHP